jgi:hypothetical protein
LLDQGENNRKCNNGSEERIKADYQHRNSFAGLSDETQILEYLVMLASETNWITGREETREIESYFHKYKIDKKHENI